MSLDINASRFQYLGFGAPTSVGQGRRAVAQEATLHQSSQSAEEENEEKDAALKQVQARDLIDFGMIPVSVTFVFLRSLSFLYTIHCEVSSICHISNS